MPFNKAHIIGRELYYIAQAVSRGELKGDGPFTHRCNKWFEETLGVTKALLTHSCTGALEMAAILLDLKEGDEVIMPSFTFTSTANAFLLRGAKPIFVDVREDTLNMDERKIEALITDRTKAICPVHYAGVGCEMAEILEVAEKYNLTVIEDAAHGILSKYRDAHLGTLGHMATFSFHETKNYSCGEGGALLINDPRFIERSEIIREKGTNRSQFFRGEVDKYTWVDIGSSFLPSEIIAAFLFGQLERASEINNERLRLWQRYYELLEGLAAKHYFRLPIVPNHCTHNAHMFYLLLDTESERNSLMDHLKAKGISAVFHYLPLHTSPMGSKLGCHVGDLPVTESIANRLLRLPLFVGLSDDEQDTVCSEILRYFNTSQLRAANE
ncbi:MAG: dTDP-4-amino-4,6-dideoxygalactose transaminase [Bdellovibrionales bacterium]|nr:dTDP-4-amino-4,6-dideoxygalactose transaminase [Bdellovibrionales bacterium]